MRLVVFVLVYLGMVFGRIPRSQVDRTGVALLGAFVLLVSGEITLDEAARFVDLPTVLLLFSLMVLSAQLRLGGFYTLIIERFTVAQRSPRVLLAVVVAVAGGLSAVFTNDVVALALAPVLLQACRARGLKPVPFLLGLACATNVGSAATLIGNPQNILIGQALDLSFSGYLAMASAPAVLGLWVVWWVVARDLPGGVAPTAPSALAGGHHTFDRIQSLRGLLLATGLLVVFLHGGLDRELAALACAGVVLLSRRFHTREMLGLVDWQLLALFAGLFVVNGALQASGEVDRAIAALAEGGLDLRRIEVLYVLTPLLSQLVSNVPAVMLLLPAATHPLAGPVLALSSTLAGNALVIGSIANIIVVEEAARAGEPISWATHARIGVPVALLTLLIGALTLSLVAWWV